MPADDRPSPSVSPVNGIPRPGDVVRARFTKWGERPHWEWEGRFLADDEHGRWWWAPAGTRCTRPGVEVVETVAWVSLAPPGAGWVASFYPDPKEIVLYVDMATEAVWTPLAEGVWGVTMVDLDLDVVLPRGGELYVDDADEFATHQVLFGYPPEVVALAERAAHEVMTAVTEGREPFATVGPDRLRQVISAG